MRHVFDRKQRFADCRGTRFSLLAEYSEQLGRLVERHHSEQALLAAKQEAERAAERAREAMTEAQAANRAKSEFLANMSHELRTPLNSIIGFSEVMSSGALGPIGNTKFHEYAKDINESGQHLLEIINDILDLAKIETGKVELHEEPVRVDEVAAACLRIIRERAQERRIAVRDRLKAADAVLQADGRKIKQVLINLLSNAVKFTTDGGRVTLETTREADGSVLMRVSDTGIGIAEEDIPKAMEPFSQVDSDLNRKYEGTGLGLPLTKALTELHGGSLTLESEAGAGTIVTVRFPAERIISKAS